MDLLLFFLFGFHGGGVIGTGYVIFPTVFVFPGFDSTLNILSIR